MNDKDTRKVRDICRMMNVAQKTAGDSIDRYLANPDDEHREIVQYELDVFVTPLMEQLNSILGGETSDCIDEKTKDGMMEFTKKLMDFIERSYLHE